jgi:membrane protease YdiL (CAAX protease family)
LQHLPSQVFYMPFNNSYSAMFPCRIWICALLFQIPVQNITAFVIQSPATVEGHILKPTTVRNDGPSSSYLQLISHDFIEYSPSNHGKESFLIRPRRQHQCRLIFNTRSVPRTVSTRLSVKPVHDDDIYFDRNTPITYIIGQSTLILLAIIISAVAKTPNFGFGPNLQFTVESISQGLLCVIPLGILAVLPDLLKLEESFPALKSVTQATLRTVLTLLGGKWKPVTALAVCTLLGCAAGLGEEMLFRGLLQYELSSHWHLSNAVAILLSSILFGALHAVTPLYMILAGFASVYFGWIYASNEFNLAVPIVCHAIYDIGALLYAHWTVTRMSATEQDDLYSWEPFTSAPKNDG